MTVIVTPSVDQTAVLSIASIHGTNAQLSISEPLGGGAGSNGASNGCPGGRGATVDGTVQFIRGNYDSLFQRLAE
jgi:hypothetical protein